MGGDGKESSTMNDTNSNEGQLPEDAAVTVTSADTLRAMASPIRMRILGTLRVNGEQTVAASASSLARLPEPSATTWGSLRMRD